MDVNILRTYADMGWSLLPCSCRTKVPITEHGHKNASTRWPQIEAWLVQHPGCAWGVATSAERGVLDIDPRNGGDDHLARLEANHGPLPTTPRVRTGGGGRHYWLRFPPGTRCGVVAPGIDRKAEGGYVIVPPCKIDCPEHKGRAYAWEVRPWEVPLAEAPAWTWKPAVVTVSPTEQSHPTNPWVVRPLGDDLLTHPGSPKGERRKTLASLVGVHLARGDSTASVTALAAAWAAKCTPSFTEWQKHVAGLIAKEEAKNRDRTTPSFLPPQRILVGVEEDTSDSLLVWREGTNSAPGSRPELVHSLPVLEPCGSVQELVPSLPPPGEGEVEGAGGELSSDWPRLSHEAKHGLFGEMLQAVEPETEADPVSVLLGWLCCFGSCVGRGAWVTLGPDQHHPALYVAVVGATSVRKGMGYSVAKWPFTRADPLWAKLSVCNGVGSGQGLIERVRDESRSIKLNKKAGEVEELVVPGAADKRCLLRLDELSACFKLQRSDSSTLGETLITAWGGVPLDVPNRSGNDLRTSDYSIAVIGDTQPGTLAKLLEKGVEQYMCRAKC